MSASSKTIEGSWLIKRWRASTVTGIFLLVLVTSALAALPTSAPMGWVVALGIALSVAGLVVSVGGFALTIRQLIKTQSAAQAAKDESLRIQSRLSNYDAIHEASRANYALKSARKHIGNKAWEDGADSYYDVRKALLSLKTNVETLDPAMVTSIEKTCLYILKFCERVDRGAFITSNPDVVAKARSVMREHDRLIADIISHIQKGALR